MPISKNRPGHRQKLAVRNQQLREQRNRTKKFYEELAKKVEAVPTSVPDMLNKTPAIPEEVLTAEYPLTPEEAFEAPETLRIVGKQYEETEEFVEAEVIEELPEDLSQAIIDAEIVG